MKIRNLLILVLAATLLLSLCACGGEAGQDNAQGTTETTEAATNTEGTVDTTDNKVTYTVTVKDEAGNPISGAFVQLCLDNCFPMATNESGVATFNLEEADYKVSFVSMPAGYTSDEAEFYFVDDSHDMTITLQAES